MAASAFAIGCLLLQAHFLDEQRQQQVVAVTPPPPPAAETREEKIVRLAAAGLSFREIGQEVSLPPGAAWGILKRLQREADGADVP